MSTIHFTLNGQLRECTPRTDESALEVLRERCGIRSVKSGCAPQGQCGACLALVDGKAKTTCAMPAKLLDGKEVLTLEGIPEDDQRILARCFVAAAGIQCGYCIPGIALRTFHLLGKNPDPSRSEIARALDSHLCRCTGYIKIIDAIALVAKVKQGAPLPELGGDGHVGCSLSRYGGEDMVLGRRDYTGDLQFDGMLHAAVVLSEHPRARVLKIDIEEALRLPGVERIATAQDVPGERFNGLILNDWPVFVAEGEETRYVGDILAAVAATDEATARLAASKVKVDYEILTPALSPDEALAETAHPVNPNHPNGNILGRTEIVKGDVATAFKQAAHEVRGTWQTQRIDHLFMEPESAVVVPREDGSLHLYSQGQGVFEDRRQIARLLAMTEEKIFAQLVPNGGGFGGKEDLSIQGQTAILAWLTQKPVKLTLNREESIRIHPKRHPLSMDYRVACDADGNLLAVQATIVGDTGCYASVGDKVLERAAGHSCGAYRVPNVHVVSTAVSTNNPPCGAMRGFGANQAHFAMEGCLDLLTEKAGLDGWEIRWRNALQVGDSYTTGQILEKSVGVKQCLQAVKDRYYQALNNNQAVGIACGIKNSGLGNGALEYGKARLVVENDGRITIYNGFTEMGQGLLTILIQCAVEITDLPANIFDVKIDSTFELGVGETTGSRGTLLGGRAVKAAAYKLKDALDAGKTLDQLKGEIFHGEILIDDTTPPEVRTGKIKTHTAFGFATQVCLLDETGRVQKMIAAHDVGRAINPTLCEAQIEGSIHMGLGYALSEELPCPGGMPATFKLREIGVLRATDMPEVEVILVEDPEPEGPFGAKGVGEIGLVPTAPAVAGALAKFDGIRRTRLPMKDSPASQALKVGKIHSADREKQK